MGFKTFTALSLPALVALLFPLCLIPCPSLAQELQRRLSKKMNLLINPPDSGLPSGGWELLQLEDSFP